MKIDKKEHVRRMSTGPRNGCYDNIAYDSSKALDDNLARRKVTLSKTNEKINSGYSLFQYRYIATLIGFFTYFELDCYRIATSMSLVKMVNNTAVNLDKNFNGTIDSCPLNYSTSEEFPELNEEGEFNWSSEIQSYIVSAGFLGYFISQIPGGLLAERYGAKNIIFSGLLISSLAHVLFPFAAWWNYHLMIAMQLLRGLGQGFLPPAVSVMGAKWFPRPERGFLNSIILEGYAVGSVITYISSGALCSSPILGGWPLVYFIYGGLGLMLSLYVHLFLYESPKEHPRIGKEELIYILENQECDLSEKSHPTPWKEILTSVPVYAVTYSIFSESWAMAQQLSEHPIFLGNLLHFSIQTNGILNSIPFAFQILLIFLGGFISKWLNTHVIIGVDKVRKGCTFLYSLGYCLGLLGIYFAGCNRTWSIASSFVSFSFVGLAIPGCLIVPADMSPKFAGSLFAFCNTIASSATFIFPLIVGALIDKEETLDQWNKIFLLCIAMNSSAGILFCLFGSADLQPWNFPSAKNSDENHPKEEVMKNGAKDCTLSIESSIDL